MARPPIVKSFLIADTVIHDRIAGKWSIIGIFDRVMAPSFPVIHPTLAFYLKLGDVEGNYKIKVEFRDSTDRRVGLIEGIQIEVKVAAQSFEVGFHAPPLPLERPGKYQFQLYVNGEFAASAPMDVVQLQVQPPPAPPSA
jgi:hypothetical protein